jgi:hypothetical protein
MWRVQQRRVVLVVTPTSSQLVHSRAYGLLLARIAKSVLKIRYLLLGGAVGGGVSLHSVRTHLTLHLSL